MKLSTWIADRVRKKMAIERLSGNSAFAFSTETRRPGYYMLKVTLWAENIGTVGWTAALTVQAVRKNLNEKDVRGYYDENDQWCRQVRHCWPTGSTWRINAPDAKPNLIDIADWVEEKVAIRLTGAYIVDAYVPAGTPWPDPLAEAVDDLRVSKLMLVRVVATYQKQVAYYDKMWDDDPGDSYWRGSYHTKREFTAQHTNREKNMVNATVENIRDLTESIKRLGGTA